MVNSSFLIFPSSGLIPHCAWRRRAKFESEPHGSRFASPACTVAVFTLRRSLPKVLVLSNTPAQRVSWEVAPDDNNDPHTFNFGLESGEVINAEIGGNDARWINHSCNPNCEAIEEDDRIFIYAMRDIQPGEELFYDYAMEIDEPIREESKKKFACHCGTSNCRGTMLALKEAVG